MSNLENVEDTENEDVLQMGPTSDASEPNEEKIFDVVAPEMGVNQEIDEANSVPNESYLEAVFELFPAFKILKSGRTDEDDDVEYIRMQSQIINGVLEEFNINAKVSDWYRGSRVVQFEIQAGKGVKVDVIERYRDNFKLRLGVDRIQIQAPIPGQSVLGIQVPRKTPDIVSLRDVLEKYELQSLQDPGGSSVR